MSLRTLATRTGLPAQRLARLLGKHHDYFVKVGGREAFALNRFGKCKGSAEATLRDIERAYRTGQSLRTGSYAVAGVLTLGGLAAGAWSMLGPAPPLLAPSAVLLILGVVLLFGTLRFSS